MDYYNRFLMPVVRKSNWLRCGLINVLTFSFGILYHFQIKKIEKSGYFGELALVTHKPRAASAYACGDVKLACK